MAGSARPQDWQDEEEMLDQEQAAEGALVAPGADRQQGVALLAQEAVRLRELCWGEGRDCPSATEDVLEQKGAMLWCPPAMG